MAYNGKNRKIMAENTKRKIYESAMKLFSTNAYDEVSVDSVVKMAGVAKGSFYVHFASKNALVTALIKDEVEKVDKDYKNFFASFSDEVPTETILLALIGKITDVLVENIGCDKMKVVYKAQITKDIDTEAITSYDREIYKMFSEVLKRGIKRGEFNANISLDILTRHFMMAIRGITYEWCIRYPEFDYKTQALQHFKLILEGLRKSPTSLS